MYYPTHRPQLTGIGTESVDCGVRATQMSVDWLSKGEVSVGVRGIRKMMDDQDETNYHQWDDVIDRLGGKTMGFAGERTNNWERVKDHTDAGGAAIIAVDYGMYRALLPNKSGSLTFSGYHAILVIGARKAEGGKQTRSFDSLLDGRYRGCPNGPVWVHRWKAKQAALEVGRREGHGGDYVFAVLLHRDPSVIGTEAGDLIPEAGATLSDILSDMRDVLAEMEEGPARVLQEQVIESFQDILGVSANPEADESTPVAPGVAV